MCPLPDKAIKLELQDVWSPDGGTVRLQLAARREGHVHRLRALRVQVPGQRRRRDPRVRPAAGGAVLGSSPSLGYLVAKVIV